jgi:hypothetical protein
MFRAVLVKVDGRSGVGTLTLDPHDDTFAETVVYHPFTHRETQFLGARRTHGRRRPGAKSPAFGELRTSSNEAVVL